MTDKKDVITLWYDREYMTPAGIRQLVGVIEERENVNLRSVEPLYAETFSAHPAFCRIIKEMKVIKPGFLFTFSKD
jgi:hypothetical protein